MAWMGVGAVPCSGWFRPARDDDWTPLDGMMPRKHGQDRLCWLSQKRAEKQSRTECMKAREIAYMPLPTLAPMASEIYHCDLTNRVKTFFTYLGS
jgi:hypothetical protein